MHFKVFLSLALFVSQNSQGREISLPAVLINSREILQVANAYHLQPFTSRDARLNERLLADTPLCQALGMGCLIWSYTADGRLIWKPGGASGPELLEPATGQLVLEDFSSAGWKDYRTAFDELDYLSTGSLAARDSAAIRKAFHLFQEGKISSDFFTRHVIAHPRSFETVVELYKDFRKRQVTSSAHSQMIVLRLEQALSTALLLTLDAMSEGADSTLASYPFRDTFVRREHMLHVSALFKRLGRLKWPAISALTPEMRKSDVVENDAALALHAAKDKWFVKGFYDHLTNTIWIDFEDGFFENVFVLYHELWHVAWEHSQYMDRLVSEAESALKKSDGELRRKLLQLVSKTEFYAIEQQINLFHATSDLAFQMGLAENGSAEAWHSSYFPEDIYKYFKSLSFRKASSQFYWIRYPVGGGIIQDRAGSVLHDEKVRLDKQYGSLNGVLVPSFAGSFLKDHLKSHVRNFEEKYLGEQLGLDELVVSEESDSSRLRFQEPKALSLTCAEASRIINVLGKNWKYGIPFPFDISDAAKLPKPCPLPRLNGFPESNGTHPRLHGFPSLNGPSKDQRWYK